MSNATQQLAIMKVRAEDAIAELQAEIDNLQQEMFESGGRNWCLPGEMGRIAAALESIVNRDI